MHDHQVALSNVVDRAAGAAGARLPKVHRVVTRTMAGLAARNSRFGWPSSSTSTNTSRGLTCSWRQAVATASCPLASGASTVRTVMGPLCPYGRAAMAGPVLVAATTTRTGAGIHRGDVASPGTA